MDRTVEASVTLNVIDERINELWGYRAWFRAHRWAEWTAQRAKLDVELRALVRLRRKARAIARDAAPDPMTAAKAEEDRWVYAAPGEWVEAWGR